MRITMEFDSVAEMNSAAVEIVAQAHQTQADLILEQIARLDAATAALDASLHPGTITQAPSHPLITGDSESCPTRLTTPSQL